MLNAEWKIPNYTLIEYKPKANKYCVCIPVINEGEKIQKQLGKLKDFSNIIDIIILDGGSTDGSLGDSFLKR